MEMINWARVNELRQEVGEEDFGEVVELFLEEVDETLTRLKCAPDPDTFEDVMHFLKGSALNLGFFHLGSICQASKVAASQGRPEDVDLESLFSTYALSKKEFLQSSGVEIAA